jgi:hypothetical protein
MRTVLTITPWIPPPRTESEMTGRVSLTIMLPSRSVTSSRCPFFLTGWIFLAYSRCLLGMG